MKNTGKQGSIPLSGVYYINVVEKNRKGYVLDTGCIHPEVRVKTSLSR